MPRDKVISVDENLAKPAGLECVAEISAPTTFIVFPTPIFRAVPCKLGVAYRKASISV